MPNIERLGIGITPAWAGKSRKSSRSSATCRDYPRVGGKEAGPHSVCRVDRGLPPRGRGRGYRAVRDGQRHRITPAWAGKSSARASGSAAARDYPRVGGEEDGSVDVDKLEAGLPPRGRGRVHRVGRPAVGLGITPAWAGKSSLRRSCVGGRWDYPRVGGEEKLHDKIDILP